MFRVFSLHVRSSVFPYTCTYYNILHKLGCKIKSPLKGIHSFFYNYQAWIFFPGKNVTKDLRRSVSCTWIPREPTSKCATKCCPRYNLFWNMRIKPRPTVCPSSPIVFTFTVFLCNYL